MPVRNVEDLRSKRRIEVPVDKASGKGKHVFICRRPTDADIAIMVTEVGAERAKMPLEFARRFVTGWQDVTEKDVFGDGDDKQTLAFSLDIWREWSDENSNFWFPIGGALIDAYMAHKGAVDGAVGE